MSEKTNLVIADLVLTDTKVLRQISLDSPLGAVKSTVQKRFQSTNSIEGGHPCIAIASTLADGPYD